MCALCLLLDRTGKQTVFLIYNFIHQSPYALHLSSLTVTHQASPKMLL